MAGRLEGKVALITGGASGQGRTAALMFAREGAKIALSDTQEEGGVQTQHLVTENGGEALFVAADVSSEASAKNMVEAALQRYGRLDILYNNAGIVGRGRDTDVANLAFDAWNQIIQVNLSGIFLGSKYAVPAMIEAGGGSIINTASVAGMIGSPNSGHAYAASKGGVIALTRAMAVKYAPNRIRVNAICPGTIDTPMTDHLLNDQARRQVIEGQHPLGYLGKAEDIVYMALYLASDESSWVTGAIFPVDGGRTAQ
jgi:NAD(P)-dependent dehydrogenase (short-subunit alcohol dehydrogenase family)